MLTWNDFRRDEEGDPGHHHEEAGWKVVGDDVVSHFPPKSQLKAGDRKVSWDRDDFWDGDDFWDKK